MVCDKTYPASAFAVHLLNCYYADDTASRIAVLRRNRWKLRSMLQKGYLNAELPEGVESDLQYILLILPEITPFDRLDIASERDRIMHLFTRKVGDYLVDCFRTKSHVLRMDDGQILHGILPTEYDEEEYIYGGMMLDGIRYTLRFYNSPALFDAFKARGHHAFKQGGGEKIEKKP